MDSDDILFICQHLQGIFWQKYLSITLLKSLKTKQCSGIPEHLQMREEKVRIRKDFISKIDFYIVLI